MFSRLQVSSLAIFKTTTSLAVELSSYRTRDEWKFGRMPRNAVETRAVLQLDRNTANMLSIFLLENNATKTRKQLLNFNHQNVNSLCSRHHYMSTVRSSSAFLSGFSINLLAFYHKCRSLIKALRTNRLVLRTSNFQGATRSIVPRNKHSIAFIVHH